MKIFAFAGDARIVYSICTCVSLDAELAGATVAGSARCFRVASITPVATIATSTRLPTSAATTPGARDRGGGTEASAGIRELLHTDAVDPVGGSVGTFSAGGGSLTSAGGAS